MSEINFYLAVLALFLVILIGGLFVALLTIFMLMLLTAIIQLSTRMVENEALNTDLVIYQ